MHGRVAIAVVGAVVAAAMPWSAAPVLAGDPCWSYSSADRDLARRMNEVRERKGLGPLRLDPELSRVARKHTREMIERNLLHHTEPEVLARRVTNWLVLDENIGLGARPRQVHRLFLDSRSHRAKIVDPDFNHTGIGAVRRDGTLWVTVVFEGSRDPGTRLRMPAC